MGMEVTELSAVKEMGRRGERRAYLGNKAVNFQGSQGERVIERKEPVRGVGAERRGKDTWGIWCRAVNCVLVGKGFKAACFLGRD